MTGRRNSVTISCLKCGHLLARMRPGLFPLHTSPGVRARIGLTGDTKLECPKCGAIRLWRAVK